MIENAENMCTEEVEIVSICFCAQNMTFTCHSLTEGCTVSLSDLDLTFKADLRLVPHAIHATQTGAKRCFILSGNTCHGSGNLL